MALLQLVYRSLADPNLTQADVLNILRRSQVKNHQEQISGLLIFRNGQFLQLIEGPPLAVHALLKTIQEDQRHREIEVLYESFVDEPTMPTWAMGYFAPDFDQSYFKDNFVLKEKSARAISELLPEQISTLFLNFLNQHVQEMCYA